MMRNERIKVILWKELKELSRDKKTLLTTFLLPLISLPLIGLLTFTLMTQQPVNIAVIDEDSTSYTSPILNITVSSSELVEDVREYLARSGLNVYQYSNREYALRNSSIDLIIIIPKGFSENATSIDRVASIEIIRRANVRAAEQAEGLVRGYIGYFSSQLSREKLDSLAKLAGLETFDVNALRDPVVVGTVTLVSPIGSTVGAEEELKSIIARLLVLSFSFVVTPASSYVIDGIIGERERKTIEMLLTSPASITEIFSSKLLVATFLGVLASLADLGGILAYFILLIMALGGSIFIVMDPVLIFLHIATTFLTILVSISIATPFIARTRGLRSASNIAGIVTSLGVIFFIVGWMIDFPKLPASILYPLMLIPYTHSILVIQGYIYGRMLMVAVSLTVLLLVSLISMIISIRFLDKEKLLLAEY
ncbi:ABC transporter permease [Desulfurococcus amylolyticus]|nr:ABC transporter permease [Desulfurococcus amylolyticus]